MTRYVIGMIHSWYEFYLIDREGPLPPELALRLILDASEALVWAEQQRGTVQPEIAALDVGQFVQQNMLSLLG